jgi:hypothetical protein
MGYGCQSCGQKLVGAIIANTCNCKQLFCEGCWNRLFEPRYRRYQTKLYQQTRKRKRKTTNKKKNKDDEIDRDRDPDYEYKLETKQLYEIDTNYIPSCVQCGTPYHRNEYEYY